MLRGACIGVVLSLLLLCGCGGAVIPSSSDVVGQWSTKDGASIHFKEDGTFEAQALPPSYFSSFMVDDVNRFDGTGIWSLEHLDESERDYRPWEITLNFQVLSPNVPERFKSFTTNVYVAGSSPMWSPPWQVVSWEYGDMDGGEMLVFTRKQ